jgi:hypothetical protein
MDDITGAPDHIEDILIALHRGQWFGWSDSKNKIYANLVIHDDQYDKPSQAFLETELAILQGEIPWKQIRGKRDQLLRDSDFTVLTDAPYSQSKKTAWETYRQELRDLPQTYDNVEDVVWPETPEV